jgi:hypothetical protein
LGSEQCKGDNSKLSETILDVGDVKTPANLRKTVYCAAIRAGGEAEWNFLWQQVPALVWRFGSNRKRFRTKFLLYLWPFGLFYGQFLYFVAIRYVLLLFGIFFPVLVCFTKKNLATL